MTSPDTGRPELLSLSTTSPDNGRPEFLKLYTLVMTPQLVLFPSGKIFQYVILPHSTHILQCQIPYSPPLLKRLIPILRPPSAHCNL